MAQRHREVRWLSQSHSNNNYVVTVIWWFEPWQSGSGIHTLNHNGTVPFFPIPIVLNFYLNHQLRCHDKSTCLEMERFGSNSQGDLPSGMMLNKSPHGFKKWRGESRWPCEYHAALIGGISSCSEVLYFSAPLCCFSERILNNSRAETILHIFHVTQCLV